VSDDGIRMEVSGVRPDLDGPISVLGTVSMGDTRQTYDGGADVLRLGECVPLVASPSEADIARVWTKYRQHAWGLDLMHFYDFHSAVRELWRDLSNANSR
jgi:hypothetical protein